MKNRGDVDLRSFEWYVSQEEWLTYARGDTLSGERRELEFLRERGGGARYRVSVGTKAIYEGMSARDALEAYNEAYHYSKPSAG